MVKNVCFKDAKKRKIGAWRGYKLNYDELAQKSLSQAPKVFLTSKHD